MPKKSLDKYPVIFQNLVDRAIADGEFRVTCKTASAARSLRGTFYAYLAALRVEGDPITSNYANKVMAKLEGTSVVFQDKARFGHAADIMQALKDAGLEDTIPNESKSYD